MISTTTTINTHCSNWDDILEDWTEDLTNQLSEIPIPIPSHSPSPSINKSPKPPSLSPSNNNNNGHSDVPDAPSHSYDHHLSYLDNFIAFQDRFVISPLIENHLNDLKSHWTESSNIMSKLKMNHSNKLRNADLTNNIIERRKLVSDYLLKESQWMSSHDFGFAKLRKNANFEIQKASIDQLKEYAHLKDCFTDYLLEEKSKKDILGEDLYLPNPPLHLPWSKDVLKTKLCLDKNEAPIDVIFCNKQNEPTPLTNIELISPNYSISISQFKSYLLQKKFVFNMILPVAFSSLCRLSENDELVISKKVTCPSDQKAQIMESFLTHIRYASKERSSP